jgi:hypothetical protein
MNKKEPSPDGRLVRAKLSAIEFPEVCPVCLSPAEDFVFITVVEKVGPDDYIATTWARKDDKTTAALNAARGHATFVVPTCMAHGSKSVRSSRTKLIALLGFFLFFYPLLYFLLHLNVELNYSEPTTSTLLGISISLAALLASLLYGLFPRALERKLRFVDVERSKDSVLLRFGNPEYQTMFLEANEMNAEVVGEDEQ